MSDSHATLSMTRNHVNLSLVVPFLHMIGYAIISMQAELKYIVLLIHAATVV